MKLAFLTRAALAPVNELLLEVPMRADRRAPEAPLSQQTHSTRRAETRAAELWTQVEISGLTQSWRHISEGTSGGNFKCAHKFVRIKGGDGSISRQKISGLPVSSSIWYFHLWKKGFWLSTLSIPFIMLCTLSSLPSLSRVPDKTIQSLLVGLL